jgi:hypothetical protein
LLASVLHRHRPGTRRYFNRSVREKNTTLKAGDWVYLRKEVHDASVNPKLDSPADGPFKLLKMDDHTLVIRQGEEDVRVSSDRVTAAPIPLDVNLHRQPRLKNPRIAGRRRKTLQQSRNMWLRKLREQNSCMTEV